jgi:hypothetical protein
MGCSPSALCLSRYSEFIVLNEHENDIEKQPSLKKMKNLSTRETVATNPKNRNNTSLTEKQHEKVLQEIRDMKNCWTKSTPENSTLEQRCRAGSHKDKTGNDGLNF